MTNEVGMTGWRGGVAGVMLLAVAGCTATSTANSVPASKHTVDPHEQTVIADSPSDLPHFTVFGHKAHGCYTDAVGVRAFPESTPRQLCLMKGATLFLTLSPPASSEGWSNPALAGQSVVSQSLERRDAELDVRLHAVRTGITTLSTTVGGELGSARDVAIRIKVTPRA